LPLLRALILLVFSALPALAGEITVFAAASLKTALDQIAADWRAETGSNAVIAYGGSSALARQIIAGAPADVFISAAPEWMDALHEGGFIRDDTRRDVVGNQLVLIAHGADAAPVTLDQNTDIVGLLDGGRLSMALVEAVPAGQYGKQALIALGLWDEVKDSLAQSENVRVALQLVALGEAPLGIVYASDAIADQGRVSVIGVFADSTHSPIVYPGAIIAASAAPEAEAFLAYLSSDAARAVFAGQGFTLLDAK
jgi:molybdate transport system substrate-binding protein